MLVEHRRRLLKYLKRKDFPQYLNVLHILDIGGVEGL